MVVASDHHHPFNERTAMVHVDTPVSLVGRAAALLKALASHEPTGATTTALARRTGLARATAHRLLTALDEHGLAERGRDGLWALGPEIYLLGVTAAPRYDVSALAQPVVDSLANLTEESAFYSARPGLQTVCLLREDGSFPLRSHVLHEGIRFPLGVASAGLAILAVMPDHEVDQYLGGVDLTAEYGQAHSAEAIRKRIASTRETGYALNPGLLVEGSWGMAATVFNDQGSPIGALTITGVEQRFGADRQGILGELLRRSAHELARSLVKQGHS